MTKRLIFVLLVVLIFKESIESDPSQGGKNGDKSKDRKDTCDTPKKALNPEAPAFVPMSFKIPTTTPVPIAGSSAQATAAQASVCQTPAPVAGTSSDTGAVSTIPPLKGIVYLEDNTVLVEKGKWPPEMDPSIAKSFVVYRFKAQETISNRALHSYLRLPYTFPSKKQIDCLIKMENNWEYCVIFERSYRVRIDIQNVVSGPGTERQYAKLLFRNPKNNQMYTSNNWIIETFEEEDGAEFGKYGYYIISDQHKLPVNAYEPYIPIITFDQKDTTEKYKGKKLMMSVNWLPGACISLIWKRLWAREEMCKLSIWNVHGLFGQLKTQYPDETYPVLSDEFYNVPGISEVFFSISRLCLDKCHWNRQWNKHGLLIDFENATEFFSTVVKLFKQQPIQNFLSEVQKMANDFEISDLENLKERISKMFPHKIIFSCASLSLQTLTLHSIGFCYSKTKGSEWTLEDCDLTFDKCKRPESVNLIIPKTSNTFSHLILTLFWLPTQINRLGNMKNKAGRNQEVDYVSSQEWRIHSMCPNLMNAYLVINYKIDKSYLVNIAEWSAKNFQFPSDLATQWPSIIRNKTPKTVWNAVYKKCGAFIRTMDIPKLRGTVRYFNQTLELKKALNTGSWQLTLDTELTTQQVLDYFKSKIGYSVALDCFHRNNRAYLVKLRICYGTDRDLTPMDCPASVTQIRHFSSKIKHYAIPNENPNCGDRLIIPSTNNF